MKYILIIGFLIYSLLTHAKTISMSYYIADNTLLCLYDNHFKLSTGIEEDITITWFEGDVLYQNDSIICIDKYYNVKLFFQKENKFILKLLNYNFFLDKESIINVRILEWNSYFWGDYIKSTLCYLKIWKEKENRYLLSWEYDKICNIYDLKNCKNITSIDSLLNTFK